MTYESTEAIVRNADQPELTINPSDISDLGSRPTFLTSKGKEKASSILQGTESIPNSPNEHDKGRPQLPKKAK